MPFLLLLPPSALVKFRKKSVNEHSFSDFYECVYFDLQMFRSLERIQLELNSSEYAYNVTVA